MASFGGTDLERITSEISRLRGMSSRLLLVAFSICRSSSVLAPEDHHPIMLEGKVRVQHVNAWLIEKCRVSSVQGQRCRKGTVMPGGNSDVLWDRGTWYLIAVGHQKSIPLSGCLEGE